MGEIGDGGLGRQTWSLVRYPRSIHGPTNTQINVGGDPLFLASSTPHSDSDMNFIQVELPQGVEDDTKLKARALDDVLMWLMETPTQCTPSDTNYDMLYKHWDTYIKECGRTINLDSELIFKPIKIDNHIACVCINFKSKTADILDNQSHPNPTKSDICKAAKILVSAMSDYLEYKGISKGSQITGFEHRRKKFDWTRSTPNHEESDIFTIAHMLIYEGQPFKYDDLGTKINRRYLVLQLAAALVLADMNKIRAKVMEDVTRWVSRKDSILVTLQAKRKMVKILAKSRSSK